LSGRTGGIQNPLGFHLSESDRETNWLAVEGLYACL
jgi:hypothetical protein